MSTNNGICNFDSNDGDNNNNNSHDNNMNRRAYKSTEEEQNRLIFAILSVFLSFFLIGTLEIAFLILIVATQFSIIYFSCHRTRKEKSRREKIMKHPSVKRFLAICLPAAALTSAWFYTKLAPSSPDYDFLQLHIFALLNFEPVGFVLICLACALRKAFLGSYNIERSNWAFDIFSIFITPISILIIDSWVERSPVMMAAMCVITAHFCSNNKTGIKNPFTGEIVAGPNVIHSSFCCLVCHMFLVGTQPGRVIPTFITLFMPYCMLIRSMFEAGKVINRSGLPPMASSKPTTSTTDASTNIMERNNHADAATNADLGKPDKKTVENQPMNKAIYNVNDIIEEDYERMIKILREEARQRTRHLENPQDYLLVEKKQC